MKRNTIRLWVAAVTAAVFGMTGIASAGSLVGVAADIDEGGLALHTDDGIRFVSISMDTVWMTDGTPEIGDVITVHYSGPEDRVMLNADAVICYRLRGTVTEIADTDEPYLILAPEDGTGDVRVLLGDIPLYSVASGLPVTVYYNGMMTRSVPPQITADYIRGPELCGEIAGIGEDGEIRLIDANGDAVELRVSRDTLVLAEIEIGNRVRVSILPQMRLSMPPQYEAQDILLIDELEERDIS